MLGLATAGVGGGGGGDGDGAGAGTGAGAGAGEGLEDIDPEVAPFLDLRCVGGSERSLHCDGFLSPRNVHVRQPVSEAHAAQQSLGASRLRTFFITPFGVSKSMTTPSSKLDGSHVLFKRLNRDAKQTARNIDKNIVLTTC